MSTTGSAFVLAAMVLTPMCAQAAWSYSEKKDPFDIHPALRVVSTRVDTFPVAAFRRMGGAGSVDLVIVLADSKRLDPTHMILLRVDSNPTQELSPSADGHLTLAHLFFQDRKNYYYHALNFPEYGGEFSWKPNRIAVPIIGDIDDRTKIDTVPTYSGPVARKPFDPSNNPPYSPEGLFLKHLMTGVTLFVRYTTIGGREVTEQISLAGLSRPLEQLLTKSTSERCSDAAYNTIVANGCFDRAIQAAQPLAPGKTLFESPAFSSIEEECLRKAKQNIPICAK